MLTQLGCVKGHIWGPISWWQWHDRIFTSNIKDQSSYIFVWTRPQLAFSLAQTQCKAKLPQGVAGRDGIWQPLLLHLDCQAASAVQWGQRNKGWGLWKLSLSGCSWAPSLAANVAACWVKLQWGSSCPGEKVLLYLLAGLWWERSTGKRQGKDVKPFSQRKVKAHKIWVLQVSVGNVLWKMYSKSWPQSSEEMFQMKNTGTPCCPSVDGLMKSGLRWLQRLHMHRCMHVSLLLLINLWF